MPEDDTDFEAYLQYLYKRDVAPGVERHRLTRRPRFEFGYEFEYPLNRLGRANSVLRLLEGAPYIYLRGGPTGGPHADLEGRLGGRTSTFVSR